MSDFLVVLVFILIASLIVLDFMRKRSIKALDEARLEIERREESKRIAVSQAKALCERKMDEANDEVTRIRDHYDAYARQVYEEANRSISEIRAELEPLRVYAALRDEEEEVRGELLNAIKEAKELRDQAVAFLENANDEARQVIKQGQRTAKELQQQAEALLMQATLDSYKMMSDAEKRAESVGQEAYLALRNKRVLEQAVLAMQNLVEGYGDRYLKPTHSLLDDLADEFGVTAAGAAFKAARVQSLRMVEQGTAADCDYAEPNRRETAIRFAIDALNGRVDAILSRLRHDNHGTLEQEIRDAFGLVNLHGQAFRNTRILPAYLDARLDELKWGAVLQELKWKEREEQRLIKERIREEEKARREYERALEEATRERERIEQAMAKARDEVEHATARERSMWEGELAKLQEQLTVAEAKNQRALSMAQQTRSGHVYIISNIGSFGEEVFKIGLTRRLEPMDRIDELGDASVPFSFDVHAMVYSEDAPALERLLHQRFDAYRVNKVNYRKEFFRIPLEEVRCVADEQGLEATFTMVAEAREYRETLALEKMTPSERQKYLVPEEEDLSDV